MQFFCPPPVTSSLLGPNILLSSLFTHTLNLCLSWLLWQTGCHLKKEFNIITVSFYLASTLLRMYLCILVRQLLFHSADTSCELLSQEEQLYSIMTYTSLPTRCHYQLAYALYAFITRHMEMDVILNMES
jgi:hypothetical protein